MAERERFQLKEEKQHYQQQLGQMVEKIGSQIEQLDRKIDSEAPLLPIRDCYTSGGKSPTGGTAISNGPRVTLIFGIRTYPDGMKGLMTNGSSK